MRSADDPQAPPFWQLLDTDQGIRPKHELFGNRVETLRDYYSLANGTQDCASGAQSSCMPGRLRGIVTQHSDQPASALQDAGYRYDVNGNVSNVLTGGEVPSNRRFTYDGSTGCRLSRVVLAYWAP